jgi:hypothetical protein
MLGGTWLQALVTFLALISSGLFLVLRSHGHGHPFGSAASARWAVAVVAATAGVASVVGLSLPLAAQAVRPLYIGMVVPGVLCARRVPHRQQHPERQWDWHLEILTAGVSWLLDRLDQQMSLDIDNWCTARLDRSWTPRQLEEAALHYHAALGRLVDGDPDRKAELSFEYEAVLEGLREARRPGLDQRSRRMARHRAEEAYLRLVRRAPLWGYRRIARHRPTPARTGIGDRRRPSPRTGSGAAGQ